MYDDTDDFEAPEFYTFLRVPQLGGKGRDFRTETQREARMAESILASAGTAATKADCLSWLKGRVRWWHVDV